MVRVNGIKVLSFHYTWSNGYCMSFSVQQNIAFHTLDSCVLLMLRIYDYHCHVYVGLKYDCKPISMMRRSGVGTLGETKYRRVLSGLIQNNYFLKLFATCHTDIDQDHAWSNMEISVRPSKVLNQTILYGISLEVLKQTTCNGWLECTSFF